MPTAKYLKFSPQYTGQVRIWLLFLLWFQSYTL